jgi:hypothetical protein
MPKIKTESLQEGMVVTTDVKNMDNMLLIPAGCALTEKHINILNAWGIPEIQVQSSDSAEDSKDILQKLSPATLAKMTAELHAIFWEPIDKNPIQREVFDFVLRRAARHELGQ